jgi:hypothetical protein
MSKHGERTKMKNLKAVRILTMVLLITVALPASLAYALVPTEPHNANAIWIEPSQIQLNISQISPGYKFNVTIWANCSVPCGGWQIWFIYESAYINATGAGYTLPDGSKSEFFQNITTIPVSPSFKSHNGTHNRVEYGETWAGSGPYRSPGYGSLAWIELNVTRVPEDAQEAKTDFYGYSGAVRRTYLIDGTNSQKVDLSAYGGLVKFLPAPPDTTPPTITILSPTNKTYVTDSVQLNFTISEPTSWIGYSLDGQENVTIVANTILTNLTEGSHNIVVFANDTKGNMGKSSIVYFSVSAHGLREDVNGDGSVGIDDIFEAALAFGSSPGHPRWNEKADVNLDDIVDLLDMFLIASKFGTGL